jgi:parallel beta-helix repeat protein
MKILRLSIPILLLGSLTLTASCDVVDPDETGETSSAITVTPYPGMVITTSVTLTPGTYSFASGQGITIGAGNITIDGTNVVLVGPGITGSPGSFAGTAVTADGRSTVTLKGLTARGFLLGLYVKNATGWTITGNNFSDNFSDPSHDWGDPRRIHEGNAPAGAIALNQVSYSTVAGNRGDNVWDGLYLYYSDYNTINGANHFSYCSNVCLKMWHSSGNTVSGNVMSYGIRVSPGETHARDSASALIETGSNDNRFLDNDFTHGGDGVFIRVLNGWVSKRNYFYNNDVSFAHNNGFESWSPDNTFENNIANKCSYGFWLGGSDHTVMIGNTAAYNGTVNANAPEPDFGNAGVAVVNGSSSHFIFMNNNIHDNGDSSHPATGLAIRYTLDYPAFHWIIQKNTIAYNSKYGLFYKDTKWVDLAANTITGNPQGNIYNGGNVTDVYSRTASVTDPVPDARSTISTATVQVGTAVTFNSSASTAPSGLPLTSLWHFGDGTTATGPQVTHVFTTPGFKRVGLTVNDSRMADLQWFDVHVITANPETGTEDPATSWSYWLESPADTAVLVTDTTERMAGARSLRVDANASSGVHWYYPAARNAQWNLSGNNQLSFWMRSLNQNSGGFESSSPTVRLYTSATSYYQYAAADLLDREVYSEGRDGWKYFTMPFEGNADWRRTVVGSPSLANINYLELAADTAGRGYQVWTDGVQLNAATEDVNLALNRTGAGYPSPSASRTFQNDTIWGPIDGKYAGTPRWTSWGSLNAQDWYAVDFGSSKTFGKVKAHFYNDNGGVKPPTAYKIQYWNGTAWVDAANQVRSPAAPAEGLNTITFTPVTASQVRILCTNQNPVSFGVYSGLTEFEVFNQLADDFSDANAVGWNTYDGTWAVESYQYSVEASAGAKSVASGTRFANFTYEADTMVSSAVSGANGGLIFRVSNPSIGYDAYNGYYVGLYPGNDLVVLGKANGSWTQLTSAAMAITPDVTYRIKIVAIGTSLKVYVNDMVTPKLTYSDSTYASGMIGLRTWGSHVHFDNIKVVEH